MFHAGKPVGEVPWASAMCPGIPASVLREQECFKSQLLAAAEEDSHHRLCFWGKRVGDMAVSPVRGQILPQNPAGKIRGMGRRLSEETTPFPVPQYVMGQALPGKGLDSPSPLPSLVFPITNLMGRKTLKPIYCVVSEKKKNQPKPTTFSFCEINALRERGITPSLASGLRQLMQI